MVSLVVALAHGRIHKWSALKGIYHHMVDLVTVSNDWCWCCLISHEKKTYDTLPPIYIYIFASGFHWKKLNRITA